MATGTMSSRNSWWMLAIRGIMALLFGLAVFIQPNLFSKFVYLFGIYALVDGTITAGTALDERASNGRLIVLLEGLVGIAFGLLAMLFLTSSFFSLLPIRSLLLGTLHLASLSLTQ